MAILKADPVRALAELQERMNRLFEEFRSISDRADLATEPGTWAPAVDLIEREDGYVLRADLPGVDSGDVHIDVEDARMTLRGERHRDESAASSSVLRAERPTGPFAVSLALPPSVDVAAIRATHRAGVLEVSMPKRRAGRDDAIRVEVDRDGG